MEHLTQMSSNVAVTAKEAAALVQAVGLPNVGGMVDTDMAGRIGEGVADFLSAFDNKLAHVHLVDGDARAGIWSPATGCWHLADQMQQLADAGYAGFITPGSDARKLPAGAGKSLGTDGALDGRGLCPYRKRRKTGLRRLASANNQALPSLPRRRRRRQMVRMDQLFS